jgi:hypothetical protein
MACRTRRLVAVLPPFLLAPTAAAVDLTVSAIEVNQAINLGTTTLVARNATVVRVKVGIAGSTVAVPGVDAELRIFSNGVEIPGSPFFSTNGPITAPLAPQSATLNHTVNFLVVPPQGTDIDFSVTVNPTRRVAETNYDNNLGTVLNKSFVCRKMVELVYVPVNYTPGGGLPSLSTIEPGRGDAFVRGIFKTGDWNYHRSPIGNLTWTQSINSSNNTLLNTLNDIRLTQIPAQGYPQATFIYGWLPGNPFSGNGQANGVPGQAAFGNTESQRFQRTFAHELGHCWGQQHNSSTINTVGFDVEGHLVDPLGIGPVMPTIRNDVMVAGLTTPQAWVNSNTFNDCITDNRSQCTGGDQDSPGGGAESDLAGWERCLRIAGEYFHLEGRIELEPALRVDLAEPTRDDPRGDAEVVALDAKGAVLHAVRIRTGTLRESCCGTRDLERTPVYLTIPESVRGREIASVRIRDLASRRALAEAIRSPNPPEVAIGGVGPAGAGPAPHGGLLEGEVEVRWTAIDADGDRLRANLLYSPDGGDAWFPVAVNQDADPTGGEVAMRFLASNLPKSHGAVGVLKVRVTDGLNQSDAEWPMGLLIGGGSPPDVHVLAPNTNVSFPRHASIVLHASGWDIDDQLLPDSAFTWTSDRQGPFATGRLLVSRALEVGTHVLTLRGTDSDGLFTERSVTVTIVDREVRRADLDGNGTVGAEDLAQLLAAFNATGTPREDLDLDGTVGPADLAQLLSAW